MARSLSLLLAVLLMGVLAGAALAQSGRGSTPVGILVVTDGKNPKTNEMEKETIKRVKEIRAQVGLPAEVLPVLSYHFNKPDERQYCEQVLHISAGELIFVGLVHEKDNRVENVFYRMDRIQDPKGDARKVLEKAGPLLGVDVKKIIDGSTSTPTVTPTPVVINTGLPIPTGTGKIELQALQVVNYDAEPADHFSTTDVGVFFNVYIKNLTPDVPHSHSITVALIDPSGSVYDRPLGGNFELKPGEATLGHDMVRRSDPKGNNGFRILNSPLGSKPGTYKVDVELDGKIVEEKPITIDFKGATPNGDTKGVALLQAYVSDEHGTPKDQFKTTDMGAFIFIKLQNLTPEVEQTHTLVVKYFDPQGRICGRALGGNFTVQKGEDLSQKEFPTDVDKEGGNGFLIHHNYMEDHPGTYKVQVLLDDKIVQESSFTVSK